MKGKKIGVVVTAVLFAAALTGCGDRTGPFDSVIVSEPVPSAAPATLHPESREQTQSGQPEHQGLMEFLEGAWGYRDGETGEIVLLRFEGNSFSIQTAERELCGAVTPDHRYTGQDGEPDLLVLTADEMSDYSALSELKVDGPGAPLGDYLADVAVCGGEALLSLRQVSKGDGVLTHALPGKSHTFLLHRKDVELPAAEPRRHETFPGFVWRYDGERNTIWAVPAAECDRDEKGHPIYSLSGQRQAAEYPVRDGDAEARFQDCDDPMYPQAVYQLTVDEDGVITKIR